MARSNQSDPDISRRRLRMGLSCMALGTCALLSLGLALVTRNQTQLVIALAIALVGLLDAAVSFIALAKVRLDLHAPLDVIAGEDVDFTMQARRWRRPLLLSRPDTSVVVPAPTVAVVESPEPGVLVSPGYRRGVVHYLMFDAVARGPLGLFETVRRWRVWLPVPMLVGPALDEHRVDWPAIRSIRFGAYETAPRGQDVFRGIRPYVRGDARRAVHWPATAHHGALMVKESDGTGLIALRVVVHLHAPGPEAEAAAGRAAWLAGEGLRQGWLVHLVTREARPRPMVPPALRSPVAPVTAPDREPAEPHTVNRRVETRRDITRRLAVAAYGPPETERWTGMTRIVSSGGDRWA